MAKVHDPSGVISSVVALAACQGPLTPYERARRARMSRNTDRLRSRADK
jgi:hypothetical protein